MFKFSAAFALFSVFGMFSPSLTAEDANPHFVVTTRLDDVRIANSASGKVKINVREILVETAGPYGKPVPERILVLFEPESGAFSWNVFLEDSLATDTSRQTRALESERVVFFKEGTLFTFMGGGVLPKLYVRDFHGDAISMDDAEAKTLKAAKEFHTPPSKQDEEQFWHTVMLKALGRDFVSPPESAAGGLPPKVTNVRWDRDAHQWIVTMQARWTEEITLDADYKLLSMKKVE